MSADAASRPEADPAAGNRIPKNTAMRIKHVYLTDCDIIEVYRSAYK
jgi:hypothetical protein